MSTNSEDERPRDADETDEDVREDEDTSVAWPQPLSSEERSRIEAETWNWDAVKVYPGGQGPGVPFPTYAGGAAPQGDGAPRASDPTGDIDVPHDGAPSSEGIDNETREV